MCYSADWEWVEEIAIIKLEIANIWVFQESEERSWEIARKWREEEERGLGRRNSCLFVSEFW